MLPMLVLIGDATGFPWTDLIGQANVTFLQSGSALQVAPYQRDHETPRVAMRLDLPDGRIIIAEISATSFASAGDVVRERFSDASEGTS